MTSKANPKLNKAISFIRQAIDEGRFGQGTVLPSIADLCAQAGVSRVTMWKALQQCKREGILTGKTKGKFHVMPAEPVAEQSKKKHGTVVDKVKRLIEKDILTGHLHGIMPAYKILRGRYSVSHATLKKALDALFEEGTLALEKRRYRIASISVEPKSSMRIVLIVAATGDNVPILPAGGQEFVHTLETECSKAGIHLQTIVYPAFSQSPAFADLVTQKETKFSSKDSQVYGYIIFDTGTRETARKICAQLMNTKKPCAFYSDRQNLLAEFPRWRRAKLFLLEHACQPGSDVSSYLIQQKHKHVAFFSPYQKAQWSQQRLAAMKSVYEQMGDGYQVHDYTFPHKELDDFSPQPEIKSLFDSKEGSAGKELRFFKFFTPVKTNLGAFISMCANYEAMIDSMDEIYARALRNRKITAWVAANDLCAAMAKDFLVSKGKKIPREISLMSFDNTMRALRYQITSYNFNPAAYAHASLDFLRRQFLPMDISRKRIVTIPGMIVDRGSVAAFN